MNILIIKTSALGDILHSLPFLFHLRSLYPEASIDWVIEERFLSTITYLPYNVQIIPLYTKRWKKDLYSLSTWKSIKSWKEKLQKKRYDMVFDLQANIKSAFITLWAKSLVKIGFDRNSSAEWGASFPLTHAFKVGRDLPIHKRYIALEEQFFSQSFPTNVQIPLYAKPSEQEKVKKELDPYKEQLIYMVALGAHWPNKKIPLSLWMQFLDYIHQKSGCFFLFIWGSEQEKKEVEELQRLFPNNIVLGKLELPIWQAWTEQADGLISVDSAALHVCAITNTPSLSFFGPSSLAVYKPSGIEHIAYQGNCPYGEKFSLRCNYLRTCPTGACITKMDIEQMKKAYEKFQQKVLEHKKESYPKKWV